MAPNSGRITCCCSSNPVCLVSLPAWTIIFFVSGLICLCLCLSRKNMKKVIQKALASLKGLKHEVSILFLRESRSSHYEYFRIYVVLHVWSKRDNQSKQDGQQSPSWCTLKEWLVTLKNQTQKWIWEGRCSFEGRVPLVNTFHH